ncbi:MAG TPA: hypothetical protein VJ144_01065, partial [Candidatus Polarisedimenticolia bacterium]|nr:hypothetical protein [Candidatus Polarisedimenticolia bacterium]
MSEKEQSVGTQLKPGMGSAGRVYEGRGKVWCGTHNRYELKEAYDGVRANEVRAELHREGEVKDARGHGSERHPGTGSSMTVLQRMGWRPMKRSASAGSWHADLDRHEMPYEHPESGKTGVLDTRANKFSERPPAQEAGAASAAAPLLRAEVETQSGGKGPIPRGVLVLGNQPQPVRQFAQLERPKKMGFAREQAGIPAGRDAAPGASKNVAPVLGGLSIEAKNKLQALRATLVAKEPAAHPHDGDVPIKSFVDDLRHKIGKRRVMPGGDLDQDANPKPAEGENTQKSPDGPVDQKGVPLPGQPIYSKEEVNYRYAPDPKRSCGECRFYLEPGSCRLVMGLILKTDVCDKFEEDDEVKRTEDEMRPKDGMQGPKVVRGHLVTESLREVGWTDEARAAAAIARQHGYNPRDKMPSGARQFVRPGTAGGVRL